MIAVPEVFDDRLALRNTRLLSFAQALYGSAVAVLMTTGGLVGHMLADDKALATLPISTFVIGTASLTVPASLFMRRVGRRTGFMVGTLCGVVGCTLAAYAILIQSFALFTLSTFLVGGYQSFALYYRFAATDTASPGFRPKAIAYWPISTSERSGMVQPSSNSIRPTCTPSQRHIQPFSGVPSNIAMNTDALCFQ